MKRTFDIPEKAPRFRRPGRVVRTYSPKGVWTLVDKLCKTALDRSKKAPSINLVASSSRFGQVRAAQITTAALRRLARSKPEPDVADSRFVNLVSVGCSSVGVFTARQLATTLHSLAILRFHPGEAELRAYTMSALDKLQHSTPDDITKTVWALATFNHDPSEEALLRFSNAVLDRLRKFTSQNIANTLWALAVLRWHASCGEDAEVFVRLFARASASVDCFNDNVKEMCQLLQVRHALETEAPVLAERCAWSAELDAEARRAWQLAEARAKMSSFHTDVIEAFKVLSWQPHVEFQPPGSLHAIDIALPESKVAIEVDGKFHFAANSSDRPLGSTAIRDRLLRAAGWRVVSIRPQAWTALEGDTERGNFLKLAIETATRHS